MAAGRRIALKDAVCLSHELGRGGGGRRAYRYTFTKKPVALRAAAGLQHRTRQLSRTCLTPAAASTSQGSTHQWRWLGRPGPRLALLEQQAAAHPMAATAQQQPQPGLSPPAGAPEPAVNRVGATSRITAGFRAVEQEQHGAGAIVADPLAAHMAGEDALATARSEWAKLAAAQGPGKHLRVPARNRLLDDELLAALEGLAAAADDGGCARDGGGGVAVNVVNIGCGMDTKPWRLALPPRVRVAWFDVDQPAVLALKQQLLEQAGAQQAPQQEQQSAGDGGTAGSSHALRVASWRPVAADLAATSLAASLAGAGFVAGRPTVWLAEALLYYIPLPGALQLLSDMRALGDARSSVLVATCIDAELLAAHNRLHDSHYFASMWYFDMDELQARIAQTGWRLAAPPATSAALAAQRYGAATYVADYGGAECVFVAAAEGG